MSSRCNGITKNGGQCKITGTFENGYCYLHKDQFSLNNSINADPSTKSPHEETPPLSPNPNSSEKPNNNNVPPPFTKMKYECTNHIAKVLLLISILLIVLGLFYSIIKKK